MNESRRVGKVRSHSTPPGDRRDERDRRRRFRTHSVATEMVPPSLVIRKPRLTRPPKENHSHQTPPRPIEMPWRVITNRSTRQAALTRRLRAQPPRQSLRG